MYCKKCGKLIDDDAIFCPGCGTKVNSIDNSKNEEKEKKIEDNDKDSNKCPNCGFNMRAFEVVCPSCGYELRGVKKGNSKIEELSEKLQNETDVNRKKELIANFYVPNTREDIIEFFTLAASQISIDNEYIDVWCSKLEQTLMKAKLSLGQTSEYEYLEKMYEEAKNKRAKLHLTKHRMLRLRIAASLILGIVGLVLLLVGVIVTNNSDNPDDSTYGMLIMFAMWFFIAIPFVWMFKKDSSTSKNDEDKNDDDDD